MKLPAVFALLLLCSSCPAQVVDSLALSNLKDAVAELGNSELLRSGTLALSVKSVRENQPVAAFNSEKSLPSASTLKLVSTATVLSVFGGDYRFQTFLESDGQVKGDSLLGNLYIRGTGDPSLGSDRFKGYLSTSALLDRWVAAVKKAGVRVITGRVIPDASYFDGLTVASTWIWGDIGNYYGAGVEGLNINENLYRARFRPGAEPGDPAAFLGIEPDIPYLQLTSQVTTGERGSGDKTIFYGNPLSNSVIFTGTIPAGVPLFTVKGSLPGAALYAGYALQQKLTTSGITVLETPKSGSVPAGTRRSLDEYQSPPLRELCQQTNFWSINLYADAFLKMAGKRLGGSSDYDHAAQAVTAFWLGRNADVRGFYIKDGSGLSPSGSVTTSSLTDILNAASREKSFDDFYKSIGILGVNGTVRNLGKGSRAAGNMRVKSGSIEGTRAYAGYVTSRSGALLSFSVIAHKYLPGSNRLITDELVRMMKLIGEL
ncbi:D-alanyl-D-alanine carboxypeptidase/D-alanyl-D-alanine endopeptidase [Dyadobacter sandarakinus]|uniref:D-alanyl-D-alanine carboxypeptidase/D-alanyl-D-alanine-endopeptidase n=1 Tax=Dyadobacter sandarakinus TaxID=2747268 RepID=A0ABX7I553_9BACT|nr:D-alanyl-D-alanine carboxypeptidase/D-alanyl-D-alanine-endopeptidase [Dyadobacter sandarakinus]QRR01234.1 D-alanyl-D-alanine carboxypeptidase/D-alanyl-D-alanine-endopeptidase [Dyadobacter sandarakinus]